MKIEMWNKVLFTITFLCTSRVRAQDKCPEGIVLKPDFVADKYLGDWYTTYGNVNRVTEASDKCIRAQYSKLNETAVHARNVGIKGGSTWVQVCGFAYQTDPDTQPAKLIVQFPGAPPGDYWVLGTDYDNFACVYACRERNGVVSSQLAGILTREPFPSDKVLDMALEVFLNNNIDVSEFVQFSQDGCDYSIPDTDSCQDE